MCAGAVPQEIWFPNAASFIFLDAVAQLRFSSLPSLAHSVGNCVPSQKNKAGLLSGLDSIRAWA
jgi:hypothetical protein